VIWLLRHGEAADGSPDGERPLTSKGGEQAQAAGGALNAMGIEIDACLTSPKVRAAETARIACEQLGNLEPIVEPKLSGGPFDPEELAADHGEEVLLVGHDPDFSMAIHRFTGAQVRLKKGGLGAINKGELIVLLRPRELALIAAAA
jgi:phosphohistidine phosphatase